MIIIDEDYCRGCRICAEFCPTKVLAMSDRINKHGYHPLARVRRRPGGARPLSRTGGGRTLRNVRSGSLILIGFSV
jgi:NAD-dependent dihydropyrimidine dehydrogenase PreA subunit